MKSLTEIRRAEEFSRHLKAFLQIWPPHMAVLRAFEACQILEEPALAEPALDLGCGDGRFLKQSFGHFTAGLDIIGKEVRRARRSGVYRIVTQGDAYHLPFAAESFSTVISNCVVEHIPDAELMTAEVARILRPGGNFVFTTWTPGFNLNLISNRADYVRRKNRRLNHHTLLSAEEWTEILNRHGLELIRQRNYLEPGMLRRIDLYENISLIGLGKLRLINFYILAAPLIPKIIIRGMTKALKRRFEHGLDCKRGVAVLYQARRISDARSTSYREETN